MKKMVSTSEEWGYRGAFKLNAQIVRVFGVFPIVFSPEPRVSKLLKYYGIFIILPWLNGVYISSTYRAIMSPKDHIVDVVITSLYSISLLMQTNLSIFTSSERIYSWLLCLKSIEKILVTTKQTEKRELIRYGLIVWNIIIQTLIISLSIYKLHLEPQCCTYPTILLQLNEIFLIGVIISSDFVVFIYLTMRVHSATIIINDRLKKHVNEAGMNKNKMKPIFWNNYLIASAFSEVSDHTDVAQKLRDLAHLYTTMSNIIRTIIKTGGIGIIAYTMGNLIRFLTRAYTFVHIHYTNSNEQKDSRSALNIILNVIWLANLMMKTILYNEICHRIHEKMQEIQELIATMKMKNRENNKLANELHLFRRLTILSRPTFSPLQIITMNRNFILKTLGCAATYLVAFIQLKLPS